MTQDKIVELFLPKTKQVINGPISNVKIAIKNNSKIEQASVMISINYSQYYLFFQCCKIFDIIILFNIKKSTGAGKIK